MIRPVYIAATNAITPIGFDVALNIRNIENGVSGIKRYEDSTLMAMPFHAAAIDGQQLNEAFAKISTDSNFTKLEKMMLLACLN